MKLNDRELFVKLARMQRIATLAAGVRVAHPTRYDGNIVQEAMKINKIIEEEDARG